MKEIKSFLPFTKSHFSIDKRGLVLTNGSSESIIPILPTEEGLGTGELLKSLMTLRHRVRILGPASKSHQDLFCYSPGHAFLENNKYLRDYHLSVKPNSDIEQITPLAINTDTIQFIESLYHELNSGRYYSEDLYLELKNIRCIDPTPDFIQFQIRYIKNDKLHGVSRVMANIEGTNMVIDGDDHKVQVSIYKYKGKRYIKVVRDPSVTEIAFTAINYIFSSPRSIKNEALAGGDYSTLITFNDGRLILL